MRQHATPTKSFLQPIIDIILTEINEKYSTNYTLQDIIIDLTRKIMENSLDNAQIAKTESETKQIEINTLLNAVGQLPEETIIKQICGILEINFDEVQTQLNEKINTRKSINQLSEEILNLENEDVET